MEKHGKRLNHPGDGGDQQNEGRDGESFDLYEEAPDRLYLVARWSPNAQVQLQRIPIRVAAQPQQFQ